mgnify:CR=1 FL=1
MAQYNYKAMDKNGKAKKGSIEAITPEKAKEKLKSEGQGSCSILQAVCISVECRCYNHQCIGDDVGTVGEQDITESAAGSTGICSEGWYSGGCI